MKTSKNFRYINFATNIIVVVTGIMLIGLVAYRVFFQPSLGSLEAEFLRAGENFNGLQEVDFKKSPDTILLATDVKCQYCTQSLPFYKKLIAKSNENPAVRVIAVLNNKSEEVENYLREHDIVVEFIPDVDLVKLKVDATPTVIWVDANRKIVGSYQGLLQEKQELAFFEVYEKRLFGR
jgi:hypothetical protein